MFTAVDPTISPTCTTVEMDFSKEIQSRAEGSDPNGHGFAAQQRDFQAEH